MSTTEGTDTAIPDLTDIPLDRLAAHGAEEGTITSVSDRFVFVRYGTSRTSAATDPADLTLLARH